MERVAHLRERLLEFEREDQFGRAPGIGRLAPNFLERARHNLVLANAIYRISEEREAKGAVRIDPAFTAYDWVIIAGYYAMYHASLSCLAKIGFKSESHAATVMAMEYFFVHKQKKLEKEYADLLGRAKGLEEQYVRMIWRIKERRETAQYQVDKDVSKRAAEEVLEDATRFVQRAAKLHEEMEEAGNEI